MMYYTFSLPFIYELHGGALNRMVSVALLPYVFALLVSSHMSKNTTSHVIAISLMSMFLDVANIFYISACVLIVIALDTKSIPEKMKNVVVYSLSLLAVNSYWLYSIIISRTINPVELSLLRKTTVEVLRNYSVPFKQLLLSTSTPHNLIEIAYHDYWIRYIPSIIVYFVLVWAVWVISQRKPQRSARFGLIAIGIYVFTTIIVSGTYSIGNIYYALYQIPFLGFIQNSVRFTTNSILAHYILLTSLLTISGLASRKSVMILFGVCSTMWIGFLAMNPGVIGLTYEHSIEHTPPNIRRVNNEIGSLYEQETELITQLEHDRLLGNILPIPSSISPYFENNHYPITSQGSDTEVKFEKAIIQTTGGGSFYDAHFRTLLKEKKYRTLIEHYAVEYLWLTGNSVFAEKEHYYDHLSKSMVGDLKKQLLVPATASVQLNTHQSLVRIPQSYRTPIVAATNEKDMTDLHIEFRKINEAKYVGVIHNAPDAFTISLKKLYYPGWKLYFVDALHPVPIQPDLLRRYNVLPHNEDTQVSMNELKKLIQNKHVTTIGTGGPRVLQYHTFRAGREFLSKSVPYEIDFISQPLRGVVQNENLMDFSAISKHTVPVPEELHRRIYTYANAWTMHKKDICTVVYCGQTNSELYFVISFLPQVEYQYAVIFSGISCLSLLLVVIYLNRKNRYES